MVRSIRSSLAIEGIEFSIDEVEKIVDDKPVMATKKELQEVKNAVLVYNKMSEYDWHSEADFIKCHEYITFYFNEDKDFYRNHGEAVVKENEIIFRAPESILVPGLMRSLFAYINESNIHPLILSSIFHYYMIYIHPFTDGNGRVARFWMSLILKDYNELFAYIPIEEQLYIKQQEYYESISKCHVNGNVNSFISFMLNAIYSAIKTTQETTQEKFLLKLNKNQEKIIELIKENPTLTRGDLAKKIGITPDGVKYNLAKLVSLNIIVRIGSTKGGHWQVIN